MLEGVNQAAVVGSFHPRQLFERDHTYSKMDCKNSYREDVPVLLYDTNLGEKARFHLPKYVGMRVSIPQPNHDLNVLSLAPPTALFSESAALPDFDIHNPSPVSEDGKKGSRKGRRLILSTLVTFHSFRDLLLPLILFFTDVALFIVTSMGENMTMGNISRLSCVIIISGLATLLLMIKRGVYSTTLALHVFLWPNIFFILDISHGMFFLLFHTIFVVIMVGLILRLRGSFYNTCWVL